MYMTRGEIEVYGVFVIAWRFSCFIRFRSFFLFWVFVFFLGNREVVGRGWFLGLF